MKKRILSIVIIMVVFSCIGVLLAVPVNAAYEKTALEGNVKITSSSSSYDISVSGTTVTAKADGGLIGKEDITVTVVNIGTDTATISFDYAASNYGSFTGPDGSSTASGSFSKALVPNESITFKLKGKGGIGPGAAVLTLSNLAWTKAESSSNVTISFDSSCGSVTAGGAAVTSGSVVSATLTDGIALVATPNGSTFLGWVDANGKILSTATSYTLKPSSDMTVKAAFAKNGGTPWFGVGGSTEKSYKYGLLSMSTAYYYTITPTYLFDDLNQAINYSSKRYS